MARPERLSLSIHGRDAFAPADRCPKSSHTILSNSRPATSLAGSGVLIFPGSAPGITAHTVGLARPERLRLRHPWPARVRASYPLSKFVPYEFVELPLAASPRQFGSSESLRVRHKQKKPSRRRAFGGWRARRDSNSRPLG